MDGLTNAQLRAQLDALSAEDAAVRYSQYAAAPLINHLLGEEPNATAIVDGSSSNAVRSQPRSAIADQLDSSMAGFGKNLL